LKSHSAPRLPPRSAARSADGGRAAGVRRRKYPARRRTSGSKPAIPALTWSRTPPAISASPTSTRTGRPIATTSSSPPATTCCRSTAKS
jgi:hypothetical protein